jgi:AcrR family transcriptional regulator
MSQPPDHTVTDRTERPRRNRRLTEAKLRQAVEDLLVEGGFSALTPTAVGQRAGVNKMLIYRYFGDLQGLIRSIAYADDFFPTFDALRGDLSVAQLLAMPVSERAAYIIDRNTRMLLARPVVLELMVWELVERNELTAIMEEARETLGLKLMAELFPDVADKPMLQAISALLSAGVTYLALRRRKIRWYSGLDLTADPSWKTIATAVERMTRDLNANPGPASGA